MLIAREVARAIHLKCSRDIVQGEWAWYDGAASARHGYGGQRTQLDGRATWTWQDERGRAKAVTGMASPGISGVFSRRRLPVYIVMDHSAALKGTSMVSLNLGVQNLRQQLGMGMLSVGAVYLDLISFAERVEQTVLSPIGQFAPPRLTAEGGCALGGALAALLRAFEYDLIPDEPGRPGDRRPLVFVLLAAPPTDAWHPEAQRLLQLATGKQANVVGVALSGAAEVVLRQAAPVVVRIDPGRAEAITAFFSWMCAAIQEAVRTAASGVAASQQVQLPALPRGVALC